MIHQFVVPSRWEHVYKPSYVRIVDHINEHINGGLAFTVENIEDGERILAFRNEIADFVWQVTA